MMFSSDNWSNNMPRFISKVNEADPFDSRLRVRGGASGRNFYIDGRSHGYLSGDQACIEMTANAYAVLIEFSFQWNPSLTSLGIRLRERHDMPDPEDNRFGGYNVLMSRTDLAFYRENYHDNYTDLTPASAALGYTIDDTTLNHCRVWVYDNAAHTETTIKCALDVGFGYVVKGTAVDTAPTAAMLDSKLYTGKSNAWIRVLGTDPRDVLIRDIRIIDLKVNYTET